MALLLTGGLLVRIQPEEPFSLGKSRFLLSKTALVNCRRVAGNEHPGPISRAFSSGTLAEIVQRTRGLYPILYPLTRFFDTGAPAISSLVKYGAAKASHGLNFALGALQRVRGARRL